MVENDPRKIFKLNEYSRNYITVNEGTYPVYVIKATDKREIPDVLKGQYVRVRDAKKAISTFLYYAELTEINSAKRRKRKKLTQLRKTHEEKNN